MHGGLLRCRDRFHQGTDPSSSIGVIAENVVFTPATQSEWLQPVLDANPPAETVSVDGLPIVCSQPLDNYKPEWNEPMCDVADWMLDLVGYGHGTCTMFQFPFFI